MKKLVILSVLCALMAIYSVYGAVTGQVENGMSAAAVFALAALVLAWRASKKAKKKKPASKPIQAAPAPAAPVQKIAEPTQQTAKSYKTVYKGTVVGVTHDGRQHVLEKLMERADEGEMLTFELEESEYKGEPSIKVMAGTMDEGTMKQIGYVAAGDVARVLPYVGTAYVDGRIYGGEDGKNYGAAIEVFVAE